MHIHHAAISPNMVQFRGYQANLARIAGERNTLVVLPTGMGKTIVALLVMADVLKAGGRRILMMAPTKPLVEQHAATLRGLLADDHGDAVRPLTGALTPAKRADVWADAGIIIATPQVVQNDAVGGRVDLGSFDLVIFDEAHRAGGEYPYAFIGEEVRRRSPQARRLGLTASPGHDVARIDEVRQLLGLRHVEIRTPTDPDVADYVQDVAMEWETLPLPPGMARVTRRLRDALADRISRLKALDLLPGVGSRPNRRDLLAVTARIEALIRADREPDPKWFQARSVQAQAIKLQHAIELAETQGSLAFIDYLERLGGEDSKAAKVLVQDPLLIEAGQVAKYADEENPKLGRVGTLVQQTLRPRQGTLEATQPPPAPPADDGADPNATPPSATEDGSRIIIFAQYRATCERIVSHLTRVPGARPVLFVGQAKKAGTGMSQKEQQATLEAFRAGRHNVLVATSVAEEGLDIPSTDLVVFYEPIASEIRSIQRRGRTGRHRQGRVVVLMTKGTQDEAAHWTAKRKEQKMIQELQWLRHRIAQGDAGTAGGPVAVASDWPTPASAKAAPTAAKGRGQSTLASHAGSSRIAPAPAASSAQAVAEPRVPAASRGPAGATQPTRLDQRTPAPETPPPTGPRIICDAREQAGGVVRRLHTSGARIETRNLDVGDYILSDRVAIERKTGDDLAASIIDGRLFEQAKAMASYPKPMLLLEGEAAATGGLRADAITGALASLSVDFGITIVQTKDAADTAAWLLAVAKREQGRNRRKVAIRPGPGPMSPDDRAHFILASLPDVDRVLAGRLLRHFGSPRAVFTATTDQLAAVEGVGAVIAAKIEAAATHSLPVETADTL